MQCQTQAGALAGNAGCAQGHAGHPTHCKTWGLSWCVLKSSSFPSSPPQSLTAFSFQPIAINSHPLKCSHHGGTQVFNFFPEKCSTCDTLSSLCHCTGVPLSCLTHSLPVLHPWKPRLNSQHLASIRTLLPHSLFPPATPWVPSCPILCSAATGQSELGRSSWTTAGQGGRCCCPALPSPQRGFTLKSPAWRPGECKKAGRGNPHLYIHFQLLARVGDP